MATKVTDLIPQRSWISKWFNSPGGIGVALNEPDNTEDQDIEDLQPPSKRPRIRMDMTHPPGTFTIQARNRASREEYPLQNETLDFLHPPTTSNARSFVASTPAIRMEVNTARPNLHNNLHQRQQNNLPTNGADDNSESSESTSGCSSLIPQGSRAEGLFITRKGLDDKMSFTNHLQSPRSLFLDGRESMSSRRPSFNASIVQNDMDRSMLSSPFYSGNTTFGGSNSIGNFRRGTGQSRDFQLKVPRRASIRVKPSNTPAVTDSTGMSQTAKRILEALEHFSSPISDAKKIPVKTPMNSFGGKKRQREEELPPTSRVGLRHLTRELAIPTVPDMLKLKRRQRLQDTTLAARRIVSANSEPAPLSLQTAGIGSTNSEITNEYHLRSDNESKKFLGKLRAKSKKKNIIDDEDEPQSINLPSIPLPITCLPTFDIPLPENNSKPAKISKISNADNEFKFSSPIKFNESTKNLKSINHFSFSEPINANKAKEISSPLISFNSTLKSNNSSNTPAMNFGWSGSNTAPRPKDKKITEKTSEEIPSEMGVTVELKTGSVMDILGKKTDGNIWECCECFIKNNGNAEQCVACKAKKPDPTKKIITSLATNITANLTNNDGQFGTQFKMSNDKWECDSCLVRNPISQTICLSCQTPKATKQPANLNKLNKSFSNNPVKSDLMEAFKPAQGSWECPGCMLRNPSNVIACPCCSASKPGLVKITPKNNPSELKMKNDEKNNAWSDLTTLKNSKTWECPSCMVRNDDTVSSCVCCATVRPGAPTTTTNVSGFGDKFKKPEGSWTCDACMVSNKGDITQCIACETPKPGSTVNSKSSGTKGTLQFNFDMPKNTGQFQFGIPKNDDKKSDTTNGFTFGIPITTSKQDFTFGIPAENSTTQSGFTFGSPKTTEDIKKSNKNNSETIKPGGFSFGVSKTDENKTESSGFSFGVNKTEENKTEQTKTPAFTFGAPKNEAPELKSSEETNNSENKSTTPAFSFVAPGSVTTTAESNAVLSASTTAAKEPFTFSAPKASAPGSPLISFGQNSASNTSTSVSSGFNFTEPKLTEGTPAIAEKKTTSFGNTTTPVFGSNADGNVTITKTANLSFVDSAGLETNKTTTFAVIDKTPAFGEVESKTGAAAAAAAAVATAAASAFGNDKPLFNATTTSFGSAVTAAPGATSGSGLFGSSTPNMFGSSGSSFGTPTPPAAAPSNMFAPAKPAEQQANAAPGLFTFGAASTQPTTAIPSEGFNFTGASPATSAAVKPVFGFGSNAATPVVPVQSAPATGFGTSSFGAATGNAATLPPFSFNAPKSDPPSFGQATAVTPIPSMFGSNPASSPATSFSTNSASSSGGFSFGAPASASSAASGSSGFNFSAVS